MQSQGSQERQRDPQLEEPILGGLKHGDVRYRSSAKTSECTSHWFNLVRVRRSMVQCQKANAVR